MVALAVLEHLLKTAAEAAEAALAAAARRLAAREPT
jgi:hypothetical protein